MAETKRLTITIPEELHPVLDRMAEFLGDSRARAIVWYAEYRIADMTALIDELERIRGVGLLKAARGEPTRGALDPA